MLMNDSLSFYQDFGMRVCSYALDEDYTEACADLQWT